MARKIQNDADLQAAAAHVRYEVELFVYAAEHLGGSHSSPVSAPAGNDKNVALDSFLLHYRNIRSFLCPKLQPIRPDDIIASDFLKEPKERNIGDPIKFSVDKERLDKMLAHLTYGREGYIAAGNARWNIAQMLRTVEHEWNSFVSVLPPEMQLWFPSVSFTTANDLAKMI